MLVVDSRWRRSESDHREGTPIHDDRHQDHGGGTKLPNHGRQLIVRVQGKKHLWRHLRIELGPSRSHHAAAGLGHAIGAPALQVLNGDEQLRLRSVVQPEIELSLRIPQMDRHSVGKGGDGHVGDGEEDLLRIERLRQEARGIGENRHGLLGVPLVADVARDLGEATQTARLVMQRAEDHIRPKERAALAHAHALLRGDALFGRPAQQAARQAGDHILRKVETDKRLPDDLVGAIALDALGSGVPRHDASFDVDEEDRAVTDAVDQKTKRLLARAQALPCLVPCGQVANHHVKQRLGAGPDGAQGDLYRDLGTIPTVRDDLVGDLSH